MATYNCWIKHRPLSTASDAVVLTVFICTVRSIGVGEKECIDLPTL
jgi:hypothetical protein